MLHKGYIAWYNEDVSFLVVSDNKYKKRVPVEIGILLIDHLVMSMTVEELQLASGTWKQVHLNTVISKRNTVKSLNILKYDLKGSRVNFI